jgi:hypothetical protein
MLAKSLRSVLPMPDYNVVRAIQADRRYEPGEAITLTPKEAKEMAALNAIDPKPLKAAPPASTGDKGTTKDPKKDGDKGTTKDPKKDGDKGDPATP